MSLFSCPDQVLTLFKNNNHQMRYILNACVARHFGGLSCNQSIEFGDCLATNRLGRRGGFFCSVRETMKANTFAKGPLHIINALRCTFPPLLSSSLMFL